MFQGSQYQKEISHLQSLNTITTKELVVAQLVHKNISKVLDEKTAEATVLQDQLTALKARPDQVKYITRVETRLQASPSLIVKELPASYTFKLENGLAVAAIENNVDSYHLTTFDLNFKSQIVVTDKKSSAHVEVSSSANPDEWISIPVSLTTIDTQKHVVLEPHIGIGIAASYPLNVSGALWSTFIHVPKGLDILGANVMANDHSVSFGMIPIAYNIGEPLPVLTNIWIAPSIGIDITGSPVGSIILGGKL